MSLNTCDSLQLPKAINNTGMDLCVTCFRVRSFYGTEIGTYHPGTSSGSSQFPEPSESPILKTVPIGHPYSRATPSRQI